jgi:hypothetical protein
VPYLPEPPHVARDPAGDSPIYANAGKAGQLLFSTPFDGGWHAYAWRPGVCVKGRTSRGGDGRGTAKRQAAIWDEMMRDGTKGG